MIPALVDHLWQSLLICAAIAGCAFMTRASRAAFRLWLWRAGALKFLFPFALLHALGEWLGFPVPHSADPAPPALAGAAAALTPAFSPGQALEPQRMWIWLALAMVASALCIRWSLARMRIEQRGVRAECDRREKDLDDVLHYPGLVASAFMTFSAMIVVAAPLLSGALADRQRRHELLIVNSLSLRQGRVELSEAAPGLGSRYRVIADEHGVSIRNASLIDIVAIVYAINRYAVWTEQKPYADSQAQRDFWMLSPRYDVRVSAPVRDPQEFDAYALRQPLTKLLAERFGLEIRINDRCQPPCGRYGVALSNEPL